ADQEALPCEIGRNHRPVPRNARYLVAGPGHDPSSIVRARIVRAVERQRAAVGCVGKGIAGMDRPWPTGRLDRRFRALAPGPADIAKECATPDTGRNDLDVMAIGRPPGGEAPIECPAGKERTGKPARPTLRH